ncbi:MAG: hypothetical protein JKY56_22145, partial [Kofleriaceae bacterium]|nr:hypothetical protein [Kofleriaceae bacterium]
MLATFEKFWPGTIECTELLQSALLEAWSKALAQHKDIELCQEKFTEALATRVDESTTPETAIAKLAVEDLYLCTAVLDGNSMAYVAFDYKLRA